MPWSFIRIAAADHPAVDLDAGWRGLTRAEPILHSVVTLRSEESTDRDPHDLMLWFVDPRGDPPGFEVDVPPAEPDRLDADRDDPPGAGHDEIGVGVGLGILGIVEVEHGLPLDDPDRHGRDRARQRLRQPEAVERPDRGVADGVGADQAFAAGPAVIEALSAGRSEMTSVITTVIG